MLVMTAKVDKKKIAIILAAALVLILGLILLFGGSDSARPSHSVPNHVGFSEDLWLGSNHLAQGIQSSPDPQQFQRSF